MTKKKTKEHLNLCQFTLDNKKVSRLSFKFADYPNTDYISSYNVLGLHNDFKSFHIKDANGACPFI